MPLYPYRCTKCDHHFEKIQKFGAKPEEVCPKCGGALERMLTAPGLSFKGAGWYVNDYAPKSASSGSGGGSGSDSSSAEKKTGGETKSESKTESKSASSGETGSSSSATPAPANGSGAASK